jgi:hypothetical protein
MSVEGIPEGSSSELIVETGSGVESANGYISISDADQYFLLRNNTVWSNASTEQKTAAILSASLYIDRYYLHRWPGYKMTMIQGLQWPRAWAFDVNGYPLNGIPQALMDAVCEAALISLSDSLFEPKTAPIKKKSIAGAIFVEYATSSSISTQYPVIDNILSLILCGGLDLERG